MGIRVKFRIGYILRCCYAWTDNRECQAAYFSVGHGNYSCFVKGYCKKTGQINSCFVFAYYEYVVD